MIPEPNLWADIRERDRDRGIDEVEYPPHHLDVTSVHTRTLPRNNCEHHFLKEELELEPGGPNGSAGTVTVSSAASMNNVSDPDVLRQRQRWTRRWYLLVIVLLYIGLLASFSLNVSLLLRKPSLPVNRAAAQDTVSVTTASIGEKGKIDFSKAKRLKFFLSCWLFIIRIPW